MTSVVETMFIPHPVEMVFRDAADPQEQLRWDRNSLRGLERLSSVPLGPGARYRGDFKGVGGIEFEFLEFDPATRMRQEVELRLDPLARLAAPLYVWVIRRRLRHLAGAVRADLDARLVLDASEQGDGS